MRQPPLLLCLFRLVTGVNNDPLNFDCLDSWPKPVFRIVGMLNCQRGFGLCIKILLDYRPVPASDLN